MSDNFSVSDLTGFEKLVAPKLLKIVYWIGIVGIVIYALTTFMGGLSLLNFSASAGLGMMVASALGLIFGVLFWRVLIEIYFVFFGIYDRLGEIRKDLKEDSRPAPPA